MAEHRTRLVLIVCKDQKHVRKEFNARKKLDSVHSSSMVLHQIRYADENGDRIEQLASESAPIQSLEGLAIDEVEYLRETTVWRWKYFEACATADSRSSKDNTLIQDQRVK